MIELIRNKNYLIKILKFYFQYILIQLFEWHQILILNYIHQRNFFLIYNILLIIIILLNNPKANLSII